MAITFHDDDKMFRLTTKNTLYVFEVFHWQYLVHRYYGVKEGAKPVPVHEDPDYRLYSFAPYRFRKDMAFSMDTLPMEYPYFGSGDFRTTALRVRNADGNNSTFFDYINHEIYDGVVAPGKLPAAHVGDDANVQTLEISLYDHCSRCMLFLYYTVFYESDVIVRYASLRNEGSEDVTVEKFSSLTLDLPGTSYDLVSLVGSHNHDREICQRTPLFYGNASIMSRRGASSHQMNPFIAVCDSEADENQGDVYGFNLVYSGNFLDECECDQTGHTRVQLGLGSENFNYRLKPGETLFAPEAVMTYSPNGFGTMSRAMHRFINRHILPEKAKERRPVVFNSWEAFYFDIDEPSLVQFAAGAAECGADIMVMDDGWFGHRISSHAGLGDWYENPERFPDGLAAFSQKVHQTGVGLGIWIEPEMVNPDSDLYREHPSWCIACRFRPMSLSRHQYVLDFSNPEVIAYLKERLSKTLQGVAVDYFKWDMNRHISEPGSAFLAPEDQESLAYRYMLGVYDLMGWLIEQYPNALLENCSGGGGRFDLGMLCFSPQIWTSDNTDARARTKIQFSTMMGYPASAMSCHVSDPKDNPKEMALKYKVAVNGVLGYEFNVLKASEETKREVKRQVAEYRTFDRLVTTGDYYRVASPFESVLSAYYFVPSRTKACADEILLTAILTDGSGIRRGQTPKTYQSLPIAMADASATYRDALSGLVVNGESLQKGFPLPTFEPDATGYDARLWHFVKL